MLCQIIPYFHRISSVSERFGAINSLHSFFDNIQRLNEFDIYSMLRIKIQRWIFIAITQVLRSVFVILYASPLKNHANMYRVVKWVDRNRDELIIWYNVEIIINEKQSKYRYKRRTYTKSRLAAATFFYKSNA